MNRYIVGHTENWVGRNSGQRLYLHEKVRCIDIEKEKIGTMATTTFALLGYACDEGVRLNQGRVGAAHGPAAIRNQLGRLPNHLSADIDLVDAGTLEFHDGRLEDIQALVSEKVTLLLEQNMFPILIGGGHDIAYGHYNGIKKHVQNRSIGIINFDAHFDLRSTKNGNNSGTPFYQIAKDCGAKNIPFNYLCLGIRSDANDRNLFETANRLGVGFIENGKFTEQHWKAVEQHLLAFISKVDLIYTTIDLDGFSSAYAPGVSAPSPMGFSPGVVIAALGLIINSRKLISLDVAEMNPTYDKDHQTAKLGASLIHYVLHKGANSPTI